MWIFHADFLVRIFVCEFLGADFFSRILGCGFFFADFVMACAYFGVRIFYADFFGCVPTEKKKNPEKIPSKNPTEKSSPKM